MNLQSVVVFCRAGRNQWVVVAVVQRRREFHKGGHGHQSPRSMGILVLLSRSRRISYSYWLKSIVSVHEAVYNFHRFVVHEKFHDPAIHSKNVYLHELRTLDQQTC